MRVVINEAQVNRNRRLSHTLFFISLGGMGIGFFYTWTSPAQQSNISCFILPLLLLMTLTSVRMANTWIREPRPTNVLADALKGLGRKYTLFHYLLPAPHTLIGPEGVFTITTIWQERAYRVKEKKWYGDEGLARRLNGFFRQDLIGNPFQTALLDAQQTQKLIDKIAPDSGIEVQPLVVFINPRGSFEVEDPLLPVLYADSKRKPSLRAYLRELQQEKRPTLAEEHLDRIDAMYGLLTRHEIADMVGETLDAEEEDDSGVDVDTAGVESATAPGEAGTVFVAQSGQLYFIGSTTGPMEEEIDQLRAASSQDVELIHAFETDSPVSTRDMLRRRFDRKRQKEQWYGLSRKDIAWLKSRRE